VIVDLTHAGLAECEAVIQRGFEAWQDTGQALLRIRDERLYERRYTTFERYCRARWDFSPQRATQLMAAVEVATTVSRNGRPHPANERVARELARVGEPEERVAVWDEANGYAARRGREPTSTDVEKARKGRAMGPVVLAPTEPAPGSQDKVDEIVEGWAKLRSLALVLFDLRRKAQHAHDLTDNQRWQLDEAEKAAWMVVDNER
jgi:hypothetical protein